MAAKVPAQYIGEHEITLAPFGRPYYDASGKPLQSLMLHKGDTLMLNDEDVHGISWWHDPKREKDSIKIGTGRVVLPEHVGLTEQELERIGWEFHAPRPDFVPIPAEAPAPEVTS